MSVHVPELEGDHTLAMYGSTGERAPIRTLVVDDSADLLEAICTFVEMNDSVEVIGSATNGNEALDAVVRLSPDLVLMDVQMPKMDGLTAATLIHDAFPETAIVLMSADATYRECAIVASGAVAFIDKFEFVRVFPRVLKQLALTEHSAHTIPS